METKPYTHRFWAKSDRSDPGRIHLLEHHLADVGACFEELLAQPTIRQRLAHTAGWDDVDATTAARLCVFAALHDIGKVNIGFQMRGWKPEDLPGGRPPRAFRDVGHTLDLSPVLRDEDSETATWFFEALNWRDDILTWDDRDGETVCGLLVATLSHHGRPLRLEGERSRNAEIWRSYGELNPQECATRIGWLIKEKWFRRAFGQGERALPSAPEFQHHFLGLCNLADWIGSNERWFEYVDVPRDDYIDTARRRACVAVDGVGLNLTAQCKGFAGVPNFNGLFDHIAEPANAIQQAAHDAPLTEPLVIVESETGSGKTEAALWRFAEMYAAGLVDGLYFALPTRAAAVQIHEWARRFVANLFPEGRRPAVVLAVPGYDPGADADAAAIALNEYDGRAAGHHEDDKPWASENPKRFLAAQIAVGTVDQAMLGSLKVRNAHLRSASLARNLLVVDEVHASDTYMSEILAAVLDAHLGAGGYALLMSATLGSVARQKWLGESDAGGLADAIAVRYPAVSTRNAPPVYAGANNQAKTVRMESRPIMGEPSAIARIAVEAARAGAKVLLVRNTVDYAVNAWQEVAALAGADGPDVLLHHGRYAAGDRKHLDDCVEKLLGKDSRSDRGCVAVGTQTLEQSLDIDADLLITDLCPADVLLQRIGRLHRHGRDDRPAGYDAPRCIVLTPGADLAPLLSGGRDANGLGPHGRVYRNLHSVEATRRLVEKHSEWVIPEMNRLLVEEATHGSALKKITEELGEEWEAHANDNRGSYISDRWLARRSVIRRNRRFFPVRENRRVRFDGDEVQIRTRLGDSRVDILLNPQPASPFDGAPIIERIAMPLWLLGKSDSVTESVEPTIADDGGFDFTVGERRFRYDRAGLRRL